MSTTLAPESAAAGLRAAPGWLVSVRPGDGADGLRAEGPPDIEPLTASGEGCTVALAGRLFDLPELAARYPQVDSADPAALALAAYLDAGERVAERLNGRFALVVWDSRKDVALAVRDRMGLYPLFWSEQPGELIFSESVETLLAHPRVSRDLNVPLLALHVVPRWVDEKDETFYTQVRRVPPGHQLRLGDGGSRLSRYWSPAPEDGDVDWIPEDEVSDRFEALLAQAVDRCLAVGPASLSLSGGLDSISIATFAAELAERDGHTTPWALSVEFPDPDRTGEADVQRNVAAALGWPHEMMTLDEALHGRGLLPQALELSSTWPTPLLGIFTPAYFTLIDRAKEQGCKVLMSGSGGDNWLSVCLDYAADLFASLRLPSVYQLWYTYGRSYRVPRSLLARRILWKYGLRHVLVSLEQHLAQAVSPRLLEHQARWRAVRTLPAWIAPDPDIRRAIDDRTVAARSKPKPKPGQFYVYEMRRAVDHPLLAVELEEAFEKGRRLGVEILMPYYDPDLVDMLCRTPPQSLIQGARSKSFVRDTVAERLPGLGIERQRKITTGNFWPQKQREAAESWRSMGGARKLGELGIVDPKALDSHVLEMLAANRQEFVPYVWEILDHEAWVRPRL